MKQAIFNTFLLSSLLLLAFDIVARNSSSPARILLIASEKGEPYQSVIDRMKSQLASMGYKLGDDLVIKEYSLDHYSGRAKNILKMESNVNYDIIVVFGTIGTIALKELLLDDPHYPKVVFSAVTDPVGVGVIENFRDPPKHNFTGVAYPVPVKKRFSLIKKVLPKAQKIGLIYADMPQSHSYNKWVKELVDKDPEFKDYQVFFRKIPFVKSSGGIKRMSQESIKLIKELTPQVDLFLSANDQLALHPFFPKNVLLYSSKPLVGVGKHDVMERRGALMAIFPTPSGIGKQTANMVKRLLEGASIKDIVPEESHDFGMAFDLNQAKHLGIKIPSDLLKEAGPNIIPAE